MTTRDRIRLKFWQNNGQLAALAGVYDSWWDTIQNYLSWVTSYIDVDTAAIELVDLLAWQRDITRMNGEDEVLYRKRVKYALANAKDAGSKAGFARIWERLGLGEITQTERFDETDWDVIRLRIDETIFGQYTELLDAIIRQYGRTCRRYEFESIAATALRYRPFDFDAEKFNCKAIA